VKKIPTDLRMTLKGRITLRDYFAAAALQGMLCDGFLPNQAGVNHADKDAFTKAAYKLADGMLAARGGDGGRDV
jgi:hypothetical protein